MPNMLYNKILYNKIQYLKQEQLNAFYVWYFKNNLKLLAKSTGVIKGLTGFQCCHQQTIARLRDKNNIPWGNITANVTILTIYNNSKNTTLTISVIKL